MIPQDLFAAIESVLRQVARHALGGQVAPDRLARSIVETSRLYTVQRGQLSGAIDPGARLLFFTLADLGKVAYPLGELLARGRIRPDASRELRVLDAGAGYGAQTLGLLAALDPAGELPLRVEAVDRDPRCLDLLEQVLAGCSEDLALGRGVRLVTRALDLGTSAPQGPHDLVLAGSVLNEMRGSRGLGLVLDLLRSLAPGGHLIIIEPALRETARELHRVRDSLLAQGAASVVAPCTHCGPCPALRTDGDWCHERRPWSPPPGFRALARSTGLRRGELKWSYLTLALPSGGVEDSTGGPRGQGAAGALRVVSDPLPSKGKLELFLCGARGRLRAVRLNRHRSHENRPFQRLRRGWIARIEGAEVDGTTLRVEAETVVAAEDPARSSRTPAGR